jgi:hypothetical protein
MIFPTVEYDAEASLHLSTCASTPTHRHAMEKGRGINCHIPTTSIKNFIDFWRIRTPELPMEA